MGTKYSTVSISSYNASPPSDDGTQDASNQITWAKHKTKIGDPLKTAIEAIDTALVAALNQSVVAKSDSYNITAAEHDKTVVTTTTSSGVDISLPDAATVGDGFIVTVTNDPGSSNALTIDLATATDLMNGVTNGSLTLPVDSSLTFIVNSGSNGYNIKSAASVMVSNSTVKALLPAGLIAPYAGSTAPSGWLACDGSAVSRTTYANLFTAIGTTWGAGDGSTTFNVPNLGGRTLIGDGTGVTSEEFSAGAVDVSAGTIAVASNADKWITGMPATVSSGGTLPNGVSAGTTYYVIRNTSTTVKLASSLANAQNGTAISLVSQGTGSHQLKYTMTARTLGGIGGEESHAMSITELLAHTHTQTGTSSTQHPDSSGTASPNTGTANTGSTGGNAAMNNMQPYGIVKWIISI